MSKPIRPIDLDLEQLAARCAEETARFFQNRAVHDNAFCFEIFRRAIVLRSDAAWEAIYKQYQTLIRHWVLAHPQFGAAAEEADFFVNAALASMWRACPPQRFTRFPSLPALLAYLKSCVHTAILNQVRRSGPPQSQWLEESGDGRSTTEFSTEILDKLQRQELWRMLQELLSNEKERLVLELSVMKGFKPREVHALHRETFTTVREVYRVKRNLIERLSRNPRLLAFHEER